jgi:hypothetical protein
VPTENHPQLTPEAWLHRSSHEQLACNFRQQVPTSRLVSNQTAHEIIGRIDAIEQEIRMADFLRFLVRPHRILLWNDRRNM